MILTTSCYHEMGYQQWKGKRTGKSWEKVKNMMAKDWGFWCCSEGILSLDAQCIPIDWQSIVLSTTIGILRYVRNLIWLIGGFFCHSESTVFWLSRSNQHQPAQKWSFGVPQKLVKGSLRPLGMPGFFSRWSRLSTEMWGRAPSR